MKTLKFTLNLLAGLGFGMAAHAQAFNCDSFTITSMGPDPFNSSNTLISIAMEGSNSDFINYPYIPVIWDCNGDTVATGQMFFFGQAGQSTSYYPVSAMDADVCFPLTIEFVYASAAFVNDTCTFTVTENLLSVGSERISDVTVFPNPTQEAIRIAGSGPLNGQDYVLIDQTGRTVMQGKFSQSNEQINLRELPSGIYLLSIGSDHRSVVRVVKE